MTDDQPIWNPLDVGELLAGYNPVGCNPNAIKPCKDSGGGKYVMVRNNDGRFVRVLKKNAYKIQDRFQLEDKLNNIPKPMDYTVNEEYATNDDNIPKSAVQKKKQSSLDVEPFWRSPDPRKRRSWPEFCRDFLGQTYGAIAQDLLMMHNSDDPALKVQFMKFILEMGKQGYPTSMQVDVNAQVEAKASMYTELAAMTAASEVSIGQEPEDVEYLDSMDDLDDAEATEVPITDDQYDLAPPCYDDDPQDASNSDPEKPSSRVDNPNE